MNAQRRALVWAAVSTKPQAEDEKFSIPKQIEDGTRFAGQHGLTVVDTLTVTGHSRNYRTLDKLAADAREKGIDAFDRLIAHFERRDFDVFICRDANRFARKASLLHYIAETIIEDCDATIYDMANAIWVNSGNVDMWATMQGFKTSSEIKWLKQARENGLIARTERGLTTTHPPFSHNIIWDHSTAKPRAVGMAVDESKRRLFNDIAHLIIEERVPFNRVEVELFERFGHASKNGNPLGGSVVYDFLHNPVTWGATGYNFNRRTVPKGDHRLWAFDETVPLPPGVVLSRNTIPPVYAGEVAERMKAELLRRENMRGRRTPKTTRKFSGIFVCGECGSSMTVISRKGAKKDGYPLVYYAMACGRQNRRSPYYKRCSQAGRIVRMEYLQAYIDSRLKQLLETRDFSGIMPQVKDFSTDADAVQREIQALNESLDNLITIQASAHPATRSRYQERINALGEQLDTLQRRERELVLASEQQQRDLRFAHTALDVIEPIIDKLWELEEAVINQHLHRLLGNNRFVVYDKQVIKVAPARSR